ncbi:MAG: isopentenyl-diphosphate delta-isomerase [Rhodobacteraceae bacterium]|nr:isopentenyl-diphosphate delta-isomerase [Paracoccaceae bacterium]
MEDFIPTWVDGTLQPVEKLAAHKKGLRHKAVSVFVVVDGLMLIQKRAECKYHTPGLWANTCCTHPNWGEEPLSCAKRRLEEELGISGLDPVWKERIEYRADVGGGMIEHELVDMFLATPAGQPEITANPDEVQETRWISLKALENEVAKWPQVFTPWLRIYLERHKTSVFGPA